MTNVKLKLMFFLLNALLTADIVHARPYSDNTTDIVIKYNTNSTYLPIDPNSDTLRVANEEVTMAEMKNQMDALMDAEQNRDEDLAKKGHKDESSEERTKHMNNRMEMMYSDQASPDKSPTIHIEEHREHTSAETHEHSHTNMEALLNAEQDRDEELSEKTMKEHKMDILGTVNKNTNKRIESQNNAEEERDELSKTMTDDHRKSEEEHRDHTSAETHKHSNTNMEALMNAEQDRDEDLSEKTMKEHTLDASDIMNKTKNVNLEAIMTAERDRDAELLEKVMPDYKILEISKKHNDEIEKQLNKEHPLLGQIIDSETDREDTLTDILFRPESEFADMPRFEFLIAAKINESDIDNGSVNIKSGVRSNYLDKIEKNSSDVLKKVDYVELVEVLKPLTSENMSAYSFENITGHEVDNDLAPDTRFTDLQTLFLACFATLLPLLGVLFATLLIRCMCRRWCPGWCSKPTDISESDSSEKDPAHQQLKSPTHETSGATMENGDGPPANGSIITMTLKNNHLIVETEERNDITKNGRETKMKYSPDNEGIFVVEVQQSTAYRPNNKSLQNSPPHDPQISTNQALIHRVPEELEKRIEEDSERSSGKFDRDKALALSSTGLSISDLSMSSIGSHNISYSYSSQMGYEQGPFGYPVYAGYDISKEESSEGIVHDNSQEPLITKTPTDPYKPVVTAAIFKQDSIIGNDALQGPGYCIEGSSDGPLLSDVQAREISLQNLHDQRDKKIENGVIPTAQKVASPKKVLTRADSLPTQREDRNTGPSPDKNSAMETITENDSDIPSKDALKGKRASLPTIRTEAYDVKEVEPRSPEFERNEVLAEGIFEPPPLITITEEGDGKCDSTS